MPENNSGYEFANAEDIYIFKAKLEDLIDTYGIEAITVELPSDLWDKFAGVRNNGQLKGLKCEYSTRTKITLRLECFVDTRRVKRNYSYELRKKQAGDTAENAKDTT